MGWKIQLQFDMRQDNMQEKKCEGEGMLQLGSTLLTHNKKNRSFEGRSLSKGLNQEKNIISKNTNIKKRKTIILATKIKQRRRAS
jgi:hypothetical protein